jgi:hypothetical protein
LVFDLVSYFEVRIYGSEIFFMSTPAPLHPVRQQLDELDGLLQRMLELPVEPAPEDALPRLPGEGSAEANGNAVALESSGPELDSPQYAEPSFSDFQFSSTGDGSETGAASALPSLSASTLGEVRPQLGAAWVGTKEPAPSAQTSSSQTQIWEGETSPWVWPLVVLNRAVDRCLNRLGRPGRWCQGTLGRACLGFLGLLLLVGALLWGILDWIQWTW